MLKLLSESLSDMPELPKLGDLDDFVALYNSEAMGFTNAYALDIGCGTKPKNPFMAKSWYGVDIRENPKENIRYADLTIEPIPFADNMFDYLTAFDFIEHVPRIAYLPSRRFPFVELMNEVWRVLKPGGLFLSHTPIFPYSAAFRDPTHVNILSHETFTLYFDNKFKWASMYGFSGAFEVLSQSLSAPHMVSLLRKVG